MVWTPANTATKPRVRAIIDVNHNNPITEATLKKRGVVACFAKISQGLGFVDPAAKGSLAMLKKLGLLRGAYHFTEPGVGHVQAAFFFAHLKIALGGAYDPACAIMLDLEPGTHGKMKITDARDFVSYIHDQIGKWPLLYGGGGLLRDALQDKPADPVLTKCPLVLADPRDKWKMIDGFETYALRQYGEDHDSPGWDWDEYVGTLEDLKANWPLMAG